MIVLVSGPRGAGKSQISELIGQGEGWYHLMLISHEVEEAAAQMSKQDAFARYAFYKNLVLLASAKLEKMRRTNMHIIIDEYWPDVLAAHRLLGVDAVLEDFGPIAREDVVVQLTATHATAVSRLRNRRHEPDIVIPDSDQFAAQLAMYDVIIQKYATGKIIKINSGAFRNDGDASNAVLRSLIAA